AAYFPMEGDVDGQRYDVSCVSPANPPRKTPSACSHPLPPSGNFSYGGRGRLTHASPPPRRKMAVASNKPAAQPAAARRASTEDPPGGPEFDPKQDAPAHPPTRLTPPIE